MKWVLALFFLTTGILEASPPNILLVVADDQRPDTIHALGNPIISTPTLDRLVARGTSFTRAYAGYPICYASRAEIITGCPAFRALSRYPAGSAINPELKTFASTFRDAGYVTWYSGKWHNDGVPTQRGYTATRALYSAGGARNAPKPGKDERGNPITGYTGWTFKTDDGKVELEKGIGLQPDNSRHIADGAIAALRETPADKPFFLHVNFAFPHDPRMWPPNAKDRYRASDMTLPKNFAPQHPFDHGNINGRDELLLPIPRPPEAVRQEIAIYYAMITDLDANLGRVIAELESSGRLQNTVILFTSDQGLALGSHGLLGKQNEYEHSIRSPLILAGPGVPSGESRTDLVMLRDLFPTCCDLAGLTIPSTVQAKSLTPLFKQPSQPIHEFVAGVFTDTQRMIATKQWKYIWYPKADREQLFDLTADPSELKDLSAVEAEQKTREELREQLVQWLGKNGDPLQQH